MKRTLSHLIALAALAGVTAASAVNASPLTPAARAGGQIERMLLSLDGNGDGQISRDEARQGIAQRFSRMDTDGDGTVSRMERRLSKRTARFAAMDANGDGVVTLPEMETALQQRVRDRFARIDADGNGAITLEEVQNRVRSRQRRGPMSLQDLDARVMRMFDRTDRNRDGVISPDEARSLR